MILFMNAKLKVLLFGIIISNFLEIKRNGRFKTALYLNILFITYSLYVCAYAYTTIHMQNSDDNLKNSSLLLPLGSQRSNTGCQAKWQESSPAKPLLTPEYSL